MVSLPSAASQPSLFDDLPDELRDTRHPYLRRQDVMEECFDVALRKGCGLHLMGAATGSGKNYVAARWCAKVLSGGVDKHGNLSALKTAGPGPDGDEAPGRRYVVVCIPNKANRRAFCRDVKKMLVQGGMAGDVADALILDLAAVGDGLFDYLTEWYTDKHGRRRQRAKGAPCPFDLSRLEAKEARLLETRWREANAKAAVRCEQATLRTDANLSDEAYRLFSEAEAALRRVVRDGKVLPMLDLDVVEEIWPAVRLSYKRPCLVVLTPQKLVYPVDTIAAGSVCLTSQDFAGKAVFVFDEVDRLKQEILGTYVENCLDFQPDFVLREMHDRLIDESSWMHGLIVGDPVAWKIEWDKATSKHPGSHASVLEAAEGHKAAMYELAKIADEVQASWERLQAAVTEVYVDEGLRYRFKTDSTLEAFDERLLFGEDNLTVEPVGSKRPVPLVVGPSEADRVNAISAAGPEWRAGEGGKNSLNKSMGRIIGVADMVAIHLDRVARLRERINDGGEGFRAGHSVDVVLDGLGVDPNTGAASFWRALVQSAGLKRMDNIYGEFLDDSVYMRGAGFYALEDDETRHPFSTFVRNLCVRSLPEALVTQVAMAAPCLGMSGTWNAGTVRNLNYDYLRDVQGVVVDDEGWESLQREIYDLTEVLNVRTSGQYDVKVGLCPESPAVVAFVASRLAGELSAGERWPAALAEIESICGGEGFVGAMKRICATDEGLAAVKDRDGGFFPLERLLRLARATAEWAYGCADKRHYAALLLTPAAYCNESDPLVAETLGVMSAIISGASQRGGRWLVPLTPEQAREAIFTPAAKDWDEAFAEFGARLSSGQPAVMVAAFQTAGFSKNVQYDVPDALRAHAVELDVCRVLGLTDAQMDIDYLYVDAPTHCLISKADPRRRVECLQAVVERTELADGTYEISGTQKRADVRAILNGRVAKTLDLPSARAEGGRVVIQAVGRMQRTYHKLPEVRILLDGNIPARCDFGFMAADWLPVSYEMRRVLEACELGAWHMDEETVSARERKREDMRATTKNANFRRRHKRRLRSLLSVGAATDPGKARDAQDEFDSERDEAIRAFNLVDRTERTTKERLRTMLKSPVPCEGYAFAENARGALMVEWPEPGECGLAGARRRVEARARGREDAGEWKVGEVSRRAARLAGLLSVPCVAEAAARDGWDVGATPDGTFHMTPYEFQDVYLGALGEFAGKAILEGSLTGYRLTRGPAELAERAGDYLVVGPDGNDTGVWVDFKHYRVGAYVAYASGRATEGSLDEGRKFSEKAESVGARRLLVVNVLADEAAGGLGVKSLEGGKVVTFPFLVKDGEVSSDMVWSIRNAIVSA